MFKWRKNCLSRFWKPILLLLSFTLPCITLQVQNKRSIFPFKPSIRSTHIPINHGLSSSRHDDNDSETFFDSNAPSFSLHHTAIRTRNIETAISFYSLFGFEVEAKFRAGPARAAWLTIKPRQILDENDIRSESKIDTTLARLELIEVPGHILQEKSGTKKSAIDLLKHESLLGINHFAIDVTSCITYLSVFHDEKNSSDDKDQIQYSLQNFLNDVNKKSLNQFGKTLRIAIPPETKIIGPMGVYELAFLYDADGCIVELINHLHDAPRTDVSSGWEPWDGGGFVGLNETS
mmetsp:Transcript_16473/g.23432  ORF Transcript_16473/g.23432 Transcript_16473/m.23432 type:complete len:291 (-) Transcript_16473:203-1075(-)